MALSVRFNPLVLAKMGRNIWQMGQREQGIETLAIRAMDAGVLDARTENHYGYPEEVFTLTDEGLALARTATPLEVLGSDVVHTNDNAFVALWYLLLLKGDGDEENYYSREPFGKNLEIFHLLSCGLDASRSSTPTDTQWEEFAGTFVDSDIVHGLKGYATCRCGEVDDYLVQMKYDGGVAHMLNMALNPKALLP